MIIIFARLDLMKVSIVTTAYNAEKYLAEAIDSILGQTLTNFEYIVVDNGSTDKTWLMLKDYAKKDKRLVISRLVKNKGIAGGRNKAVSLAKGEYLAWQDADDWSVPERLAIQKEFLDKHQNIAIVGGWLQFFDEQGDRGIRRYAAKDKDIRTHIFRYAPIAQPAAMIRRECLSKTGQYNPEMPGTEDLEMSFRLGLQYKFANIQQVLVHYRDNSGSATYIGLRNMERSTLVIRRRFARSNKYSFNFGDAMYNTAQFCMLYLIPPNLKIKLFNWLRNDSA